MAIDSAAAVAKMRADCADCADRAWEIRRSNISNPQTLVMVIIVKV
jgi:hypothetical protein